MRKMLRFEIKLMHVVTEESNFAGFHVGYSRELHPTDIVPCCWNDNFSIVLFQNYFSLSNEQPKRLLAYKQNNQLPVV